MHLQRSGVTLTAALAWCACALAQNNSNTIIYGSPRTGSDSGSGSDASAATVGAPGERIEVGQRDALSGVRTWVDPDTPDNRQSYVSSRGARWELVMSDEFNNPARNFTPGQDHMWTSLEKPDGVNGAVEYLSHNMTYVQCDSVVSGTSANGKPANASSTCYLTIKVTDETSRIKVYNQYSRPPGYQYSKFYYRAGMIQSWNKFCFQGGMLEVRAQLPGAVSSISQNPDLGKGPNARASSIRYYPTWPGIWMMGNLGRAIFSASTNRMWPFSYNECKPEAFDPKNQRISACNANPGHGLNPRQGRGAPEIDLLEGGGDAISSSIQIGPGVKKKFRQIPVNENISTTEYKYCIYDGSCMTPGANLPNVPTRIYKRRGYQTWYKGLRYGANGFCDPLPEKRQSYEEVSASLTRGIVDNRCTVRNCPASNDVQSDLTFIDGNSSNAHWGINSKGTCFAVMNNYMGSYLCDPDNTNKLCEFPRNATTAKTNVMEPFNYQMDALSANWGIHVGAYTGFLTYQVEWVLGNKGYLRWMLSGNPIYEIPASVVVNGPQDKERSNPTLTFPEEPMYIIFNVALSSQWGARPPFDGKKVCRGDGSDPVALRVCDSFPMYMKIDYVRLYQDRSKNSTMAMGCSPKSHPTRKWILDHRKEYEDDVNKMVDVEGGAACRDDFDCTVRLNRVVRFRTGLCQKKRCVCSTETGGYWGGPRCTTELLVTKEEIVEKTRSFGPPLYLSTTFGGLAFLLTLAVMLLCTRRRRRKDVELQQKLNKMKAALGERTDQQIEKTALLPGDFDEVEMQRHVSNTPQATYRPVGKGA